MMGNLEIINYIKCSNSIELVGISSDNTARLQRYVADGNEMVQIYNMHGAN